jgi:hypothetical protein
MTGAQHPFSFAGQKAVVIAGSAGIGKGITELIPQLGGQVDSGWKAKALGRADTLQ